MIITLKGCTATAFIGGLNFFKISKGTVSGADVTISTSTINKDAATSTSARDIATVALKSNYENLVVTVTMGGTTVNWYAGGKVTIPANTAVTGDIKISASATAVSGGDPIIPDEPDQPGTGGGSGTTGNGQWLSVLVTGDKNAHTEFMNYTETIGALSNVPCAYVKPEIQKHLSGKRVTKFACYALGSDSSISFYTNNYVQSGTTSGDDNWQKVFTLTDPSSTNAAGTKVKREYDVNFTIEEGDTLAFYDMVEMYSPKNDKNINISYFLPVSYTINVGGKYGTALPYFIAFDFYVE